MNWAWAGSIEQLWRSPGFPMWLAIAAACLFGVVVLVALLRAEKSVANGALALIAVLAIGAAATAFLRNGPAETAASRGPGNGEVAGQMQQPALACLDDLAGDTVLAACEKLLFASPDMVAAAVSYTSARINRLSAAGDVATANKAMTPELDRLRRSIERDRYGLVAYVLASRDRCLPGECAAYASLTDHNLIAANMDEKVYEAQIERYAPSWNACTRRARRTASVCGDGALVADRQADQCRVSDLGLDPAGQHHDARAPGCVGAGGGAETRAGIGGQARLRARCGGQTSRGRRPGSAQAAGRGQRSGVDPRGATAAGQQASAAEAEAICAGSACAGARQRRRIASAFGRVVVTLCRFI